MGIIQKLFGTEVKKKSVSPFSADIYGAFSNNNGTGFFRRKDYLDEYKNWAYACITARAEAVGDIKLKLYKNGKEIDNHDALEVLDRVNPYLTRHGLIQATQSFLDLDGNAFWYLVREGENGDGAIQEIYILRPDKVLITQSIENPLQVGGYVYVQNDGKKIPFTPKQIIHFKNFNPTGNHPFPHRGMGIVEAAHWAIDTDNEVRQWNYKFFKNSAKPDGVLEYSGDGTLSPEDYKRITEQWKQEHQGAENAHKTAVLSGGVTWKEITRSQSDMEFSTQRIFSRDEILALFRVPKTIIGITDDVNRANADASIYVFNLRTVKPLMQHFVDFLNEFYVPEFADTGLKFDFVSPVPEDRAAVIAEYSAGIDKWLSRNEIRAREGLQLTDNGDTLYGTLNQVEIDKAPTPSLLKAVSEVVEKEATSPTEKVIKSFISKMPVAEETKAQLTSEQKAAYAEVWKANLATGTKPFQKDLVAYFNAQEREVQRNLRDEYKGLEAKEFRFKGVRNIIFDEERAVGGAINLITPRIKEYLKRSGDAAANLVGGTFDDETSAVAQFTKKRAALFADSITATTKDKLLSSLQEGIDASETINELSDRVAKIYKEATDSRTIMIARTEASAASNFGATEAYSQAGVEKHEWMVVDPEDEDCKGNEGVVVKIGDEFPDGSILPPDPHPNCQCTTVPVF